MATDILRAIDIEIGQLESKLKALREARSAIGGGSGRRRTRPATGRRRRKLTAAEKKAISIRMKAAWAKRKAAR